MCGNIREREEENTLLSTFDKLERLNLTVKFILIVFNVMFRGSLHRLDISSSRDIMIKEFWIESQRWLVE